MKATIRDPEVLAAIRPRDFIAHLRARGWQNSRTTNSYSVWTLGDEYEVVLPSDVRFKDYALRISEALRTLEIAEERSQLEIVTDLQVVSADVIRVRAAGTTDGNITLDDGLDFVSSIREMILAAACAVISRRRRFPTRKPNEAMNYLQRVELGQTERGSYVATIISHVTPKLTPGEEGNLFDNFRQKLRYPTPRLPCGGFRTGCSCRSA